MNFFMAGFFLVFSFFKFLNLKGFVKVYQTYDLIAKKIPFYGYHYKGAALLPGELDKEVGSAQLHYLAEHEKWITEIEARALIAKPILRIKK